MAPAEDQIQDDPRDDKRDRALLQRIAQDRDVQAMEALYIRFRPRLVPFLTRITRDEGLIEEAFNDVMSKVWDNAAQYKGQSKVSSWIFSIAYRICLRMVKKQQRRESFVSFVGDALPDVASSEGDPGIQPDRELAQAVKRLSAKHRMVIELCYFEGYALEGIAEIIDCPVNTVKTRLHHARKKLEQYLSEAS